MSFSADYGRPRRRQSAAYGSFCGKKWPEIITQPSDISRELELTIRRWSDGDCTTAEMFQRIVSEVEGAYFKVVNPVRIHLQKKTKPLFKYNQDTMTWELTIRK